MNLDYIWRDLHELAETSFKEVKTTDYIANMLEREGVRVQLFKKHTGLIAEIGSGEPVIGFRADMDALWQEVNGEMKANHSCGHDAHMTIGIGTLLALKKNEASLKGTFRCIFQPAEEQGNGSLSVINSGGADGLKMLFGVHLRPKDELSFGEAAPSISHGGGIFFEGKITGEDLHGARPHQGTNAIEAGFALQQQLHTVRISPMIPHSVKMTSFHAGASNYNIIPGSATFALDVRAQTNEAMDELKKLIDEKIRALSTMLNVKIEGYWIDYTPGAAVNEDAEAVMREAIVHELGDEALRPRVVTPGSDDFHFYTIEKPELKAVMLGLGADLEPGLHHPDMRFNHDCLEQGVRVISRAVGLAMEE
ncbi:amidohydrolase [Jeotgalibacillus salarius]|uniref:Amidohydrolase n=1 Tax=Jeotgalibacillus salarius TaxID=546023 RepID=A0A4Y8LNI2_9BACL|nr:amidohydrolase [Jeotgalibacillus salarius]TFE03967.1 amidohydrolase [Jeotgalibacillus salarius]